MFLSHRFLAISDFSFVTWIVLLCAAEYRLCPTGKSPRVVSLLISMHISLSSMALRGPAALEEGVLHACTFCFRPLEDLLTAKTQCVCVCVCVCVCGFFSPALLVLLS